MNGEAVKVEVEEKEKQEEGGGGGGHGRSPAKEIRGRSPQKEITNLSPSKSESSIVSALFLKRIISVFKGRGHVKWFRWIIISYFVSHGLLMCFVPYGTYGTYTSWTYLTPATCMYLLYPCCGSVNIYSGFVDP